MLRIWFSAGCGSVILTKKASLSSLSVLIFLPSLFTPRCGHEKVQISLNGTRFTKINLVGNRSVAG